MPRHATNRLTTNGVKKFVRTAKPGQKICDGAGLWLVMRSSGPCWVFQFMLNRRARDMGLGTVRTDSEERTGLYTLAEARELAFAARRLVKEGRDPIQERAADRRRLHLASSGPTFAEVTDQFLSSHEGAWRNAKHRVQWRNSLAADAAEIAKVPVAQLVTEDIKTVLSPIWGSKTSSAKRLQLRIERVIDFARAHGHSTSPNPATWRGHLDKLFPSPEKIAKAEHFEAMAFAAVPPFMARLRERTGVAARALELAILTVARTAEVIGMRWDEVNFEEALWVIPASRMKADREHRVPLTPRSLDILREVNNEGPHVFSLGTGAKPISFDMMRKELRRMGEAVTVHGFRSSFRDWASEATSFPAEIAEQALAHVTGSRTERSYRRGDVLQKRREMMIGWDQFCAGRSPSADVVALVKGGAQPD